MTRSDPPTPRPEGAKQSPGDASPNDEPESDAGTPSRRGLWLRLAASVVLAGGFTFLLAGRLPPIPADRSIAVWVVVAYIGTLLPYHALRAGRWYFLVQPLVRDDTSRLKPGQVTAVSLAGYMWIALLPFRLGEFARPIFLAQRSRIKVTEALGTVAVERVVDGVLVCALFFVGISAARSSADVDSLKWATTLLMGAFGSVLVAMIVAAARPAWVGTVAHACLGWVSPRLANWAATVLTGMASGLRALPSVGHLSKFVLMSLAYWATNAAGMWLLAWGCGLELGLQQTVTVLAVMNIALLIPGGPAQFGVFQTGIAVGLHLFLGEVVIQDAGSRFAFYLYVCQIITIVVLGVSAQRSLKLDWRQVVAMGGKKTTS